MEIEEGQAQVIQKFVNKASTLETTSSLANLIVEATSHPSLFAFSEILSLPNILQVCFFMFEYLYICYPQGTSAMLPKLSQDQILKLKQLTVLTLSETNKVLFYNKLQEELEVSNVQFAAERDLMHGQLGSMIDTLGNCWCGRMSQLLFATFSRNTKVELMKERKISILRCKLNMHSTLNHSTSRTFVSWNMVMVLTFLVDQWNMKRISGDPRGDGHRTVTGEEGRCTLDVSPGVSTLWKSPQC
ncbi:hypothetical protein Peur_057692 [Populus x canadensis]